jgi:hypothetical protein
MPDDVDRPRMGIPMPTVLTNSRPAFSNHDPQTSGDAGPTYSDAELAAAKPDIDSSITEYARELWRALDEVGQYLREELAHGGSGPVRANRRSVLTTDEQWREWCDVYAGVLSVLAGPAGDEGYGEQEARLEYQNRKI